MQIIEANLNCAAHQQAVVELLNAYATDPFGDGKPLGEGVKAELIDGLRSHPTTLVFLAVDGEEFVGIAVCFYGFSTFAAQPLINIHDFFVRPEHRGRGIGLALMSAVEEKARATRCCKLTLEVHENNGHARKIYEAYGFSRAMNQEEAGEALAMSKPLGK